MEHHIEELRKGIETGFVNEAYTSYDIFRPELLVNDGCDKKVAITIREQLQECDRFWFSVAFITTSGLACLKQELIELERKGIPGKILTSQYLNFTQPEALKELLKFSNIEVRIAVDSNFHAKGYLFNKSNIYNLVIGSSNCTANALMRNKEWNLKVSSSMNGAISTLAMDEFNAEFERAKPVTRQFIDNYKKIYDQQKWLSTKLHKESQTLLRKTVTPNKMQEKALRNLSDLRVKGQSKALIISATGTGKTYLSAFDALNVNPKRLLFIVHRANIAKAAMKSYQSIFNNKTSFGLYSGSQIEADSDFIFSTVQTISRDEHLNQFEPDAFDYIVIDETHRASANSYQKIIDYFTPNFLLGMTATPERTDGDDIFQIFDHNIAYEIRLHDALEMDILSPFHYYGVTDVTVDGNIIDDKSVLNLLVNEDRVQHIIQSIKQYGCDNGIVRGLVFCSHVNECLKLAEAFKQHGYRTVALTGKSTEAERDAAINRLESINYEEKIDYIFSVGIFNEGVDIPSVNQVVMLRPTESAIIFVQQLGRGLRKSNDKDYLTVIDFIGNYKNNFLVPIALFGDRSYNKDTIRRLMSHSGGCIAGASTIDFDQISKERIYKAIDATNLQTKRELSADYKMLKYKLGRAPMMMDFIDLGYRDPFAYVKYSKSFFSFAQGLELDLVGALSQNEEILLQVFSNEINNGKRVGESIILNELLKNDNDGLNVEKLKEIIKDNHQYTPTYTTIESLLHNLNFKFFTKNHDGQLKSISDIYGFNIITRDGNTIQWHSDFIPYLSNDVFKRYLKDSAQYSIHRYTEHHNIDEYYSGFQLYKKYSRKDVFRILNWETNPNPQIVGGYKISSDQSNCPIFVTYHKEDDIADTIQYEDYFINESEFHWMSKNGKTLESPDVSAIKNHNNKMRIPLFIKKNNDEGDGTQKNKKGVEFYYMGDVTPMDDSFKQTTMPGGASVVSLIFKMKTPVKRNMYKYLLDNN